MSEDVQYKLRLPAELHRHLSDLAKQNNRSMNAEIVARLEQTFASVTDAESPGLTRAVQELESLHRLGALTYELQRATLRVELLRNEVSRAIERLQGTLKDGTAEEQSEAKASCIRLQDEMNHYLSKINAVEEEISEIHHERKVSGLKELRDVRPVSVVLEARWSDATTPVPKPTK